MNKSKILAIIMAITMVSGTVALSGCGTEGKSAYDIWLDQGNTGTEQDFLNSLKGNGEKGKSAYDIWLEQGNTGTEQDFLDRLKGTPGTPGQPGERGNKITHGEGAPTSTEGAIEGDMYVDTAEWNVYFFESGEWQDYGSIKGADDNQQGGSSEKMVKDLGPMSFTSTEQELNVAELDEGLYYAVVEIDSEAASKKLYLGAYSTAGSKRGFDMYSPVSNSYKGAFVKKAGEYFKLTIATADANTSISGNVKIYKVDSPKIIAGEIFEIPVIKTGGGDFKIDISAFVGHKVNVEITECSASNCSIKKTDVNSTQIVALTKDASITTKFTGTFSVTDDTSSVLFTTTALRGCNVKLKITLAD